MSTMCLYHFKRDLDLMLSVMSVKWYLTNRDCAANAHSLKYQPVILRRVKALTAEEIAVAVENEPIVDVNMLKFKTKRGE